MSRMNAWMIAGLLACMPTRSAPAAPVTEAGAENLQLELQQVLRMTLDRAPEVLLAQAQAERSREAVREVRSLNQPQAALGTGLAYNNGYPLSMEGSAPSIFQFGVSQSLFSKKNKMLIQEAEENHKANQWDIEVVRNNLALTAALAYCELHQARRTEAIWTSRIASVAREWERAEAQLQAGRARPVDVTQASTAVSRAKQQLLMAREQALVAEAHLKELTGIAESSTIVTSEPVLDAGTLGMPADRLYQRALEASPEIRQAEALLQARERHVLAEKGESLPRLDLIGQYALFSKVNNYQDYFNRFSRNNFLVGMSIQVPIFNGHRTDSRVTQSRQEVTEARLRLQGLKSELKMNLERAASALRIAQGAAELAAQEVVTARQNLQVQETLLEAGRVETRDVEAARDLLREKELFGIDMAKTLFQRQAELLRLNGTFASLFKP